MYPAEHREYWAREPSRRAITKLATLTNKTEDEVITEIMDFARRTREMTGIVLMEWQVIHAYEVTYGAADIQPLQTPNARRDARSTLYAITRKPRCSQTEPPEHSPHSQTPHASTLP